MALGNILITAVPMPSGIVSSKYRDGNNPNGTPSLSGAPTTLSFIQGTGGTFNFGAYGTDPDNDSPLTYALVGTSYTGITMSNTGLLTVGTNATAAVRNLVISITDPGLLSSNFTCQVTITAVASVADFVIPVSSAQRTINGASEVAYTLNSVAVRWESLSTSGKTIPSGGDTIVLEATSGVTHHGPIKFINIRGTSLSDLIYIKAPTSGSTPAIIRRVDPAPGGFALEFTDCRFFKIDGYMAARTSNRSCGIKIMYAKNAATNDKEGISSYVKLSASSNQSTFGITDNCILAYIEIDGGWQNNANSVTSNGIGISTNSNEYLVANHAGKWQENITIEYCWVKNTEGEGMYIGPNWYTGSLPCRNATIRYNRIENTNWTGFQLKSWASGTNVVYGNYIYNAGFAGDDGHSNACQLLDGTYQAWGNHFELCFNSGLTFWLNDIPASYGILDQIAYNNVIVDPGNNGINVGSSALGRAGQALATPRGQLYNNTIVRAPNGNPCTIESDAASGSFIRNNLAANCGSFSPATSLSNITVTNNRSGTVAAQNFFNDPERNYRLTASSPARDAGISGYPFTDFDGVVVRPSGASADQGAFEYVA
jgi:hypothetical protein